MTSTIQRLPSGRNEIKVCHEIRSCLLSITYNEMYHPDNVINLPIGGCLSTGADFPPSVLDNTKERAMFIRGR